MTQGQKYVAWGTGILLWVCSVSTLLNYIFLGDLDAKALNQMIWMVAPLLVIATNLFVLFKAPEPLERKHLWHAALGLKMLALRMKR